MKTKLLLPLFIFYFITSISFSQDWIKLMNDPTVNFYDVQKEFNKSLNEERMDTDRAVADDEDEGEIPGYMQYKRWEWFMEQRVYPSGDRSLVAKGLYDERQRLINNSSNRSAPSGNWTLLGPTNAFPVGSGAGRINCIAIHPTNSNIIFAGAASGGLWKSTDGGGTWSTNTDNLAVMGVTGIAINPVNPNIMYIATGDGDANDTYSVGILKSTDGGNTWSITSLSFPITQNAQLNRIVINPGNPNMIYVGSSLGFFLSKDAGANWLKTLTTGGIKDIEFKPAHPNVVYAASASAFYRSTNSGLSFTKITSGLPPATGVNRLSIAVTPADSNYVYVLAGQASISGFYGLYRSTNGGTSFSLQSTKPNILGWVSNGSDSAKGGQSWYTLGLAASPTNKDEIVTGGVNIWHSSNGGVSWNIIAQWQGSGAPYVHADIHYLEYMPGSGTTIFAGSDGGVAKTINNGTSWTDLSNGLQIGQMYRLGCSVKQPNVVIQGWQDNGSNKWSSGKWSRIIGGDGMECFIDWSDSMYVYGETYNGALKRSTNGGLNFSSITTGITELSTGAWVTPWVIDPKTPTTLYAGYTNLWKSPDRGTTWSKTTDLSTGGALISVAVAPSAPSTIYVASTTALNKTTDGGTTWTNITAGSTGGTSYTYIAVSGKDPNRLWVTHSGYTATSKVFKSTDGGASWKNIGYDLPNIPVNCVVVDTTSPLEGIYVGTDLGVYYIDTTRTSWLPFNNGLPNVIADELEIQYSLKKLRVATFGRGLWETVLYDVLSLAPAANFVGDTIRGCPGFTVDFTDMSTNNPTSWNWKFPNGNPSSSTLQNPSVSYSVAGTYNDVKLVATNVNGADSITKYSYVGVSPAAAPVTNPSGSVTICAVSTPIAASYGVIYKWLPTGQASATINVTASGIYSVIVTDMFGCKDTSAPVNLTLLPTLPTPTITSDLDTLICSLSGYTYQWYTAAGVPIAAATAQTYLGIPGTSYYVVISDSNGCTKQSATVVTGINQINSPGLNMTIFPSPNDGSFILDINLTGQKNIIAEIRDITGRLVYSRGLGTISGNRKEVFSTNLSKGIYSLSLKAEDGMILKKFAIE